MNPPAIAALVGQLALRVGQALAQEGSFAQHLVQRFDDMMNQKIEERMVRAEKAAEDVFSRIHERTKNIADEINKVQGELKESCRRLDKEGEELDKRHEVVNLANSEL